MAGAGGGGAWGRTPSCSPRLNMIYSELVSGQPLIQCVLSVEFRAKTNGRVNNYISNGKILDTCGACSNYITRRSTSLDNISSEQGDPSKKLNLSVNQSFNSIEPHE